MSMRRRTHPLLDSPCPIRPREALINVTLCQLCWRSRFPHGVSLPATPARGGRTSYPSRCQQVKSLFKIPAKGIGTLRTWPFWAGAPRLVVPPVLRRVGGGLAGRKAVGEGKFGRKPGFSPPRAVRGQPLGNGTGFPRGHRRAGLRRPGYRAVFSADVAGFRFLRCRNETERAHPRLFPLFPPTGDSPMTACRSSPPESPSWPFLQPSLHPTLRPNRWGVA
jgi:hypothetical protein